MKHIVWLFLCLACCPVLTVDTLQAADKVRTWTDVQGRTMQAEFIREVDGDVAFLKDGKLITIPLERLSEADRKTIRELEANKVVPEEAKPAGATPSFVDPTGRAEKPPATDSGAAGARDAAEENRVWTDTRGNKFMAKFVRVHDGSVVLLRGARTMTIPFDSLSGGDQTYVREMLTARGEANLLPPATANNQNLPRPPGETTFDSPPQTAGQPKAGRESSIGESEQNPEGTPSPQAAAQSDPEPAAQPSEDSSTADTRVRRRPRIKFDDPKQVIGFFIGLPILAAIGSLIGAIILRAATYWVMGAHLSYGDAYGVAFLMYIVNGFLSFAFAFAMSQVSDDIADMMSWATLPVGFLVQAGVISNRLEISFGEACLVTLVMILTWLAIVAIIVAIGFAVIVGLKGPS